MCTANHELCTYFIYVFGCARSEPSLLIIIRLLHVFNLKIKISWGKIENQHRFNCGRLFFLVGRIKLRHKREIECEMIKQKKAIVIQFGISEIFSTWNAINPLIIFFVNFLLWPTIVRKWDVRNVEGDDEKCMGKNWRLSWHKIEISLSVIDQYGKIGNKPLFSPKTFNFFKFVLAKLWLHSNIVEIQLCSVFSE